MNNFVGLDRAVCQIDDNDELIIRPQVVQYIFPLILIGLGLVISWVWIRNLSGLFAILFLADSFFISKRIASQARVKIIRGTGVIIWRRLFWERSFSFGEVLYVEVLLDRKRYAWSAHFVDLDRKKVDDLKAILRLILKGGTCITLGKISGEHAESRILPLARMIGDSIGIPVKQVGVQ